MGFLDFFKKKKESDFISRDDTGIESDSFKSDPFMDSDSGLNLPKDDVGASSNPYLQSQDSMNKNPFQKYRQQDSFEYEQNNNQYNNQHNSSQTSDQKDLQIIIAKLDALRAEVQAINHRLDGLERKNNKRMW